MRMLFGATTALALAAAMAATPASALVLTFKVNVESVSDQADFTPFSFEETWTWNPTYTHTAHPDQQDLVGQATVDGPSLVTESLAGFAQVDPANPDPSDSRFEYIRPNTLFFGLNNQASSATVIFAGEKGAFDDVVREGLYSRAIGLGIFGTESINLGDISDEAVLRGFLTGRTLGWSEQALFRFVTAETLPYEGYERRLYLGTATLVNGAAVPEPSAWSIMILGFAGAGAALRRRRLAA